MLTLLLLLAAGCQVSHFCLVFLRTTRYAWTPGMFVVFYWFCNNGCLSQVRSHACRYLVRGAWYEVPVRSTWYEVPGTRYLVRGT
jgi:hypothetical protein